MSIVYTNTGQGTINFNKCLAVHPLTCSGCFATGWPGPLFPPAVLAAAAVFSFFCDGGERPLNFPASFVSFDLGEVDPVTPADGRLNWEEPGVGIWEAPGIRDVPGLLFPARTYKRHYLTY